MDFVRDYWWVWALGAAIFGTIFASLWPDDTHMAAYHAAYGEGEGPRMRLKRFFGGLAGIIFFVALVLFVLALLFNFMSWVNDPSFI